MSDRIVRNDDLVLTQAGRQKSFAASSLSLVAKKINQLKNTIENKVCFQHDSEWHFEKDWKYIWKQFKTIALFLFTLLAY